MKTVKIRRDLEVTFWGIKNATKQMYSSVGNLFPFRHRFYEVSLSVKKTKRTPRRAAFLVKTEDWIHRLVSEYKIGRKRIWLCPYSLRRFVNPDKDFWFGIKKIKED